MKHIKKYTFGFLLLTKITFGQVWTTVHLNEFAVIGLPANAQRLDTLNMTIYKATDSVAIYMANVADLTKRKDFQLTLEELPEIYKGVINGTLESTQGKLISKNYLEIANLKGIEILYTSIANPNLPPIRYKRILYVNGFIFTYEFWTTKTLEEKSKPNREKFFKSFSLALNNPKQYTIEEPKKDTAFIIGQLIGYMFGLAVIIGIIFLIRHFVLMDKK